MRTGVLDLLLPPRCPACHAPRSPGLCARCTDRAGDVLAEDLAPATLDEGIVAVGAFRYDGVVADAIRTVKRPGRHAATPALARLLWLVVAEHIDLSGVPRTWVPGTAAARRRRGEEIPQLLAGPEAVPLLATTRNRPDQTELDRTGRQRNVRGAFSATGRAPPTVVCVDDVRTTGSTLLEAGRMLRAAGARRVLGVTLAVAGLEEPAPTRSSDAAARYGGPAAVPTG